MGLRDLLAYTEFLVEGRSTIARWEFVGALWIITAGVPLHFLYSSRPLVATAWLAPINESTWEHFKLAFWPGLAWAVLEWKLLPRHRFALWSGKLASLSATPMLISGIFYGYSAMLGTNHLALDIATFVVSVLVGQLLGFHIWSNNVRWPFAPWLIAFLASTFIVFTFRPPHIFLFQDPRRARTERRSQFEPLDQNVRTRPISVVEGRIVGQ